MKLLKKSQFDHALFNDFQCILSRYFDKVRYFKKIIKTWYTAVIVYILESRSLGYFNTHKYLKYQNSILLYIAYKGSLLIEFYSNNTTMPMSKNVYEIRKNHYIAFYIIMCSIQLKVINYGHWWPLVRPANTWKNHTPDIHFIVVTVCCQKRKKIYRHWNAISTVIVHSRVKIFLIYKPQNL